MRVIDIFCGAGGFSEGFRQAGFDVILGIDKWEPAVTTHNANHRRGKTLLEDVLKISLLPDEEFNSVVPDSEVIIGSPPCVSFSNSNKSGKADKGEGIELIKAFLRIVARKKWKENSILKYWILENVPNSRKFIKDRLSSDDLGIYSSNHLIVRNEYSHIYNAEKFGVPSRRKRFFCGEFPLPTETVTGKDAVIHLRQVLNALGAPHQKYDEYIDDPNYKFSMKGSDVTDHHYEQLLAKHQWVTAKRLKQDKGYMGKMSFPEDLDRPARTVMATMTFGARESMIFSDNKNNYRAPTIREVATLMSFPIDYKFYGKSIGIKYRLVGNAVPPKLAFAFADAINQKEGLNSPIDYQPVEHAKAIKFFNLNNEEIPIPVEKPRHRKSRFKYHIPYLILDSFRVELTNYHSNFNNEEFIWSVEVHRSQGPRARKFSPILNKELFTNDEIRKINDFIFTLSDQIVGFDKFQEIYCMTSFEREEHGLLGPFELLHKVKHQIKVISNENSDSVEVELDEEFNDLPREIALGYYILTKITIAMEGKPNEC